MIARLDPNSPGMAESEAGMRIRVAEGGRVVIPAEVRRELGLEIGDDLILQIENGELRLLTPREAVRRAQELVAQYVPRGESLVDVLIAERRAEYERE